MRGNSDKQSAEDAALNVFIALDKNKNDRLTLAEFITGCRHCGGLLNLIEDHEEATT